MPAAALTRDIVNGRAVLACQRPGEGLFVSALDRRLRRGITLPAWEHDLAVELSGDAQTLFAHPPVRVLGL